ncbi:MAG: carboxypeptidase regulatory-like domain-containing protein [Armatimonadetes bacterium]|nr:carboxypeptidase regulatory-like domain-containing protein [Armatimonadota bacterium]
MQTRISLLGLIMLGLICALAVPVGAQVWDATQEFSIYAGNPNVVHDGGIWTYGWKAPWDFTGPITPYVRTDLWATWPNWQMVGFSWLRIEKRQGGGGWLLWNTDTNNYDAMPWKVNTLRWTAPTSGTIIIDGKWWSQALVGPDPYPLDTAIYALKPGNRGAHIYKNDTELFTTVIAGEVVEAPFYGLTTTVNAGDTIDFMLDRGIDEEPIDWSNQGDSTGLLATISKIGQPGGIVGTVTDSVTTNPVAGATVELVQTGEVTITAANGTYSFSNLPAPRPYMVTVSNPHYTTTTGSVTLPSGGNATTNVALVPFGSIHGTITDDVTNQPIQGATVELMGKSFSTTTAEWYTTYSTTTAVNGSYAFEDLPIVAEGYIVTASAAGYTTKTAIAATQVPAAGDITVDVALGTSGSLSGAIKDASTTLPVEGATVHLSGTDFTATTGAGGDYSFTDVPATYYEVSAYKSGYSPNASTVSVPTQGTTVDLALGPGGAPTVMFDAHADFDLTGKNPTYLHGGVASWSYGTKQIDCYAGPFRPMEAWRGGTWRWSPDDPCRAERYNGFLFMHPGGIDDPLAWGNLDTVRWTSHFTGGILITGEWFANVFNQKNKTLNDNTTVDVHIYKNGIDLFSKVIEWPDLEWPFELYTTVVPGDTIDFMVGWLEAPYVIFQDGTGLVAQISTFQTGRIRGTVTDAATNMPVDGATVQLVGTSFWTTTGPDGKYDLADLPTPKNYTLSISKLGYVTRHVSAGLDPGADIEVNVELSTPPAPGSAKTAGAGSLVGAKGIVTAVFGDRFVVEDEDRSSGITVSPVNPTDLEIGEEVVVIGTLQVDGRLLLGEPAQRLGRENVSIAPLGVNNRDIAGVAPMMGGGLVFTTFGGGSQIWLTSDTFKNLRGFAVDPAAASTAFSGSARQFYAPVVSPSNVQDDMWVEYEIPEASAPFPLTGRWGFYARASMPPNDYVNYGNSSDWVIVNGDPADVFPGVPNPTDAQWLAGLNSNTGRYPGGEVILNGLFTYNMVNYRFGWASQQPIWDGHGKPLAVQEKYLDVIDGKAAFRLYERLASPMNALIDVICWSRGNYAPTDTDCVKAYNAGATIGLGNVGNMDLLIVTWGRVLDASVVYPDGSTRFHITDGYAREDGPTVVVRGGTAPVGAIEVIIPASVTGAPPVSIDDHVTVTGIATKAGALHAVAVRMAEDLNKIGP